MQDAVMDLNRRTEVVLQAARACGWLAYRPDEAGRLLPADRELWAQVHSQVAGRISKEQLADRFSWLDVDGKPVLPELDKQAWQHDAKELARKFLMEKDGSKKTEKKVVNPSVEDSISEELSSLTDSEAPKKRWEEAYKDMAMVREAKRAK